MLGGTIGQRARLSSSQRLCCSANCRRYAQNSMSHSVTYTHTHTWLSFRCMRPLLSRHKLKTCFYACVCVSFCPFLYFSLYSSLSRSLALSLAHSLFLSSSLSLSVSLCLSLSKYVYTHTQTHMQKHTEGNGCGAPDH